MTEWWQGFGWGFVFAWAGSAFNLWVARRHSRKIEAIKAEWWRRRKPNA